MDLRDPLYHFPGRFWKWILIGVGVFILVWISFLDSHSLYFRYRLHREKSIIEQDTTLIGRRIRDLEVRLQRRLTDAEVERIAREQYGMSKDGETVYPIKKK